MSDSDLKHSIGKRVHDYRVHHNYTQAQFAEIMDVSVNFLSEIENGKKGMSQDTLYKLCSYFQLSADYILFGVESEKEKSHAGQLVDIANKLSSEELECLITFLVSLKRMREMEL